MARKVMGNNQLPPNHTALTVAPAATEKAAVADAVGKNAVMFAASAETMIVVAERSRWSSSVFFYDIWIRFESKYVPSHKN